MTPQKSKKGVIDFIYEKYPKLPENVTIINPELKIKTYDLFKFIDLGVIFNGTLGLEMMLFKIPVVSTGITTHGGLSFAMEPENIEDYKKLLTKKINTDKVDYDKLELFAYFYFIKTLIPWKLTDTVFSNKFVGFNITDLDDLTPGNDPYLDHICNNILSPKNHIPEAWG